MSRFVRHLKNRMLGFPVIILPMMGFSSCDNSNVFQSLKLVSIGRACSEPFSHLQHMPCCHQTQDFETGSVCSQLGLTNKESVAQWVLPLGGLCWTSRKEGLASSLPTHTTLQHCSNWVDGDGR